MMSRDRAPKIGIYLIMDSWITSFATTISKRKYYRGVMVTLAVVMLILLFFSVNQMWGNKDIKFIVYYGDFFPAECEKDYSVFILSPHTQANITELAHTHLVAGYLSLGEVDSKQSYFNKIGHKSFVLHRNPFWPDARLVDVRDLAWQGFILHEMIPNLIEKGYNGLFLDTLDSAIELERLYPKRYKGSIENLISFIKKIKQQYPNLKLIANNAFSILPKIDSLLEYVLAESLFTSYDFASKKYQLASDDRRLKHANKVFSQLTSKPMVLEYAIDPDMISKVREKNKTYNFSLYFSNIQLNQGCSHS
jgi:endo-alpha-1,4-polygalactosaminidase (GH114 family)